jgi:osmotically-inducible protein OsmY
MRLSTAMMRLGLVGFLALVPAARSVAQESPDEAIESKIEASLKKDSILAARSIDVESEHGRVTLTGAVKTADEKARAERLARIAGVVGLINELEIDPHADRSRADRAADATKEGLNKASDATVKGAQKAGKGVQKGVAETEKGIGKAAEKTADAVGTAGGKVTDTSLTTSVKNGFSKDPLVKSAAINVDTRARVVTLRGTVASADVKTRAEEIARGTAGVARVVNELVIDKP